MDLIYCVEDDEGIRDLITYAVKSAGFEAEGFESASDFEKRLGERLPSMVLLCSQSVPSCMPKASMSARRPMEEAPSPSFILATTPVLPMPSVTS